ncbi:hypothetical protein RR48_03893 [Papilio machaon]|uniref:MADF domain-containing protein n=1 Tax=Papilio machaon TaxID=76193 RepID=A0A0N1ID95_PAPMA|nr:hypothetical protein RR48_03893 [Papilio machaon]
MKPRTWPAEEIKSLISYYESLPELWQVSNPDYKNRVKKSAAVDSLAEQFNTTAFEINRKLHNLRTQFNNELRKLKKKSGQGTDENYTSNWEYFTSLKFLMPNIITTNETQGDLVSSLVISTYVSVLTNYCAFRRYKTFGIFFKNFFAFKICENNK